MAFIVRDTDLVRESFASTGTTITKGLPLPNCRPLSAVLVNGDVAWMVARKGAEFSVGEFTDNGTTVSQTDVWVSSNANAAVSFSSGTGEIYLDAPSRLFDELNLKEITVASAATTDIGAAQGAAVLISGSATITSLGSTTKNKRRMVRFGGAATLTHNASTLALLGGITRIVAAGDVGLYKQDNSGNWKEYHFVRVDGHPLTTGNASIASAGTVDLGSVLAETITITGSTGPITSFGSTAPIGATKFVKFSSTPTITHHATSMILPGAESIVAVAGDSLIAVHEGSGNWRIELYTRGAGRKPTVQKFTASGTWTKPAGLTTAIIEVVGGGGSSGGCAATGAGQVSIGGSAGGGGYSRKRVAASALGATETVTVGTGAAAPAAGANNGSAGNTSSFGAHCSATGGSGGGTAGPAADLIALGAAGGLGSSGDLNAQGPTGEIGNSITGPFSFGGSGGGTALGGGGRGGQDGTGTVGGPYGGGGGGPSNYASRSARAGAAGADGVVFVTEFFT